MGVKEDKLNSVLLSYYSRKDIQKAIYEFCQNRETVPKYLAEGFGKRPNTLEYPTDVVSLAKGGATSLHCSEERWSNPLEIETGMSREKADELRIGWDFLVDIDSKYFDYAKKAAISIVKSLKYHKIKSIGIKFSGGKGFHIIVPWEAFPKELNGIETRKMFPEWPRIILEYLMNEVARPILEKEIEKDPAAAESLKKVARGIRCEKCGNIARELLLIKTKCPFCKREESLVKESDSIIKKRKCPECSNMIENFDKTPFYKCDKCKITSLQEPESFSSAPKYNIFEHLGLDFILVAPRHLFRAPYSLHEKTSLASAVITEEELEKFQHKDADPIAIKIRNFLPPAKEGEATQLLLQALDWKKSKELEKKSGDNSTSTFQSVSGEKPKKDFAEVKLNKDSMKHPPSIEKILNGLDDGKKRALFILLNYFRCIGFTNEEITKAIEDWNKKNKKPLLDNYIKAQLSWHLSHKKILPPNYDKSHYKDIGINPTEEELRYKNPVNFAVKAFFKDKSQSKNNYKKQKP